MKALLVTLLFIGKVFAAQAIQSPSLTTSQDPDHLDYGKHLKGRVLVTSHYDAQEFYPAFRQMCITYHAQHQGQPNPYMEYFYVLLCHQEFGVTPSGATGFTNIGLDQVLLEDLIFCGYLMYEGAAGIQRGAVPLLKPTSFGPSQPRSAWDSIKTGHITLFQSCLATLPSDLKNNLYYRFLERMFEYSTQFTPGSIENVGELATLLIKPAIKGVRNVTGTSFGASWANQLDYLEQTIIPHIPTDNAISGLPKLIELCQIEKHRALGVKPKATTNTGVEAKIVNIDLKKLIITYGLDKPFDMITVNLDTRLSRSNSIGWVRRTAGTLARWMTIGVTLDVLANALQVSPGTGATFQVGSFVIPMVGVGTAAVGGVCASITQNYVFKAPLFKQLGYQTDKYYDEIDLMAAYALAQICVKNPVNLVHLPSLIGKLVSIAGCELGVIGQLRQLGTRGRRFTMLPSDVLVEYVVNPGGGVEDIFPMLRNIFN